MFEAQINMIRIQPSFVVLAATLLAGGCGGGDDAGTPPPAPTGPTEPAVNLNTAPAASGPVSAPAGQPGAVADATSIDPAAEAKRQQEERAKLEARIKAGEEGTTLDPVIDRRQEMLDNAYQHYFNAHRKAPASMQDLVKAGYLDRVPQLPPGKRYKIDPDGGGISIVSGN